MDMPERTRKLDRNRRRFFIRLSDLQTLWFENMAQELRKTEKAGVNPNYGDILDEAIEGLPAFQKWVRNRMLEARKI